MKGIKQLDIYLPHEYNFIKIMTIIIVIKSALTSFSQYCERVWEGGGVLSNRDVLCIVLKWKLKKKNKKMVTTDVFAMTYSEIVAVLITYSLTDNMSDYRSKLQINRLELSITVLVQLSRLTQHTCLKCKVYILSYASDDVK